MRGFHFVSDLTQIPVTILCQNLRCLYVLLANVFDLLELLSVTSTLRSVRANCEDENTCVGFFFDSALLDDI